MRKHKKRRTRKWKSQRKRRERWSDALIFLPYSGKAVLYYLWDISQGFTRLSHFASGISCIFSESESAAKSKWFFVGLRQYTGLFSQKPIRKS
mmetsp:Transcript_10422/g.27306  ORF Transcript_10422/g.27306 Transcript_10422/m.27306 type:complete len:93 (-) Transcript_10422:311-589(-)